MDYFITHSGNCVDNNGEADNSASQSSKEKQFDKQTIGWLKEYYKIDDETLISEYASRAMELINIKTLFHELNKYASNYFGYSLPLSVELIDDTLEISQCENTIYVNTVMSTAFLSYIATQMHHSNTLGDELEDLFSYQYTLFVLNDMCFDTFKLPVMLPNGESINSLLCKFKDNQHLLDLSSDIYHTAMAFALLHEIAHAYLKHSPYDKSLNKEIEADCTAFRIFLDFSDDVYRGKVESDFKECMLPHTYMAPMYLLEFYYMVYYTGSFLCSKQLVVGNDFFDGIVIRKERLFDVFYEWEKGENEQEAYDLYNFYQDGQESFLRSFVASDKQKLLDELKKRNDKRALI